MANVHVPIRQGLDTALTQRRPAFTFVNITTPDDISDPNKQRTIRRHARAIATRRGRRPRTGPLSVTFDLVEGPGNSVPARASSSESPSILPGPLLDPPPASPQDHDPHVLQSLEFLKPIGWGRGITPFSPFPIEVNQRMLQLVNFSISPHPRLYTHSNPGKSASGNRLDSKTTSASLVGNWCLRQIRIQSVSCECSSLLRKIQWSTRFLKQRIFGLLPEIHPIHEPEAVRFGGGN